MLREFVPEPAYSTTDEDTVFALLSDALNVILMISSPNGRTTGLVDGMTLRRGDA